MDDQKYIIGLIIAACRSSLLKNTLYEGANMQELLHALKTLQLGGMAVYPLLLLGIATIVISLDKAFVYWRYVKLPESLLLLVETYSFAWTDLDGLLKSLTPGSYYGRFFQIIIANRVNPAWWVESRAADEAQLIEKALHRGLWVLETIVTAAPLLGLVGTIVGMMESFRLIGGSGLVNPTGITGGVAQALICNHFRTYYRACGLVFI